MEHCGKLSPERAICSKNYLLLRVSFPKLKKNGDEEDDSRTDSVLELITLCKLVIGGEGTDDEIDCGEK